jgi:hypothetical protein
MINILARSDLSELTDLARLFRCENVTTGAYRNVLEVNEARARRQAALEMGCCESRVRVVPCALESRGAA